MFALAPSSQSDQTHLSTDLRRGGVFYRSMPKGFSLVNEALGGGSWDMNTGFITTLMLK